MRANWWSKIAEEKLPVNLVGVDWWRWRQKLSEILSATSIMGKLGFKSLVVLYA